MIIVSSLFFKEAQDFLKMGIMKGHKKLFEMGMDVGKGREVIKGGNGSRLRGK